VVVLGIAGTDTAAAASVARRLRAAGITAVLDASDRRLDRRLATASRQGARAAVLVGTDEAARGAATWKDLDSGRQETAPVDEVAAALRLLLTGQ
jgi:histidyl-tRNA synthetase